MIYCSAFCCGGPYKFMNVLDRIKQADMFWHLPQVYPWKSFWKNEKAGSTAYPGLEIACCQYSLDVRAKPNCQIWLIFGNILSIFERRGESQGLNYAGLFQSPPPARRAPPFLSEVPCVRTCMFYGHQLYSDNFMFYVRLDRPTSDLCCVWGALRNLGSAEVDYTNVLCPFA